MRRLLGLRPGWVAAALCVPLSLACSRPEERAVATRPPVPTSPRATDPPAGTPLHEAMRAPHGGTIAFLAIADDGDVAITGDALGALRVWPSLDGTQPPVVVQAAQPTALAIGHAGNELVAAIRDQVGGLEIVRLARDGALLGRTQVRDDVAVDDVFVVGGDVLVLRADRTIARYDSRGAERGRIAADAGERVLAIAARRGGAIAMVGTNDSRTAAAFRWIALDGDRLRWGATVKLPAPITGAVALAPNKKRIAAQSAAEPARIVIYDLDPTPTAIVPPHSITVVAERVGLGFADDDHLGVVGSVLAWWPVVAGTRGAGDASSTPIGGEVAFGDGHAIAANMIGLAVSDPSRTQYLGYDKLAAGTIARAGSRLAISTSGVDIAWLDQHLDLVRSINVTKLRTEISWGIPVGEHHVVAMRRVDNKFKVELWNVDTNANVELDGVESLQRVEVSRDLAMLALARQDGTIVRFALDLAHDKVKPLAPLDTKMQLLQLQLLDPARDRGKVAIVVGYVTDKNGTTTGPRIAELRDRTGTAPIVASRTDTLVGSPLAIDQRGAVWEVVGAQPEPDGTVDDQHQTVIAVLDGKEVARFTARAPVTTVEVAPAGDRVLVRGPFATTMYAIDGKELWTVSMWGGGQLMLSPDGRTVYAQLPGGLVALDASTGKRVAVACAWGFGLHATPPPIGPFGLAPVCATE
jgi:hypothetical protein